MGMVGCKCDGWARADRESIAAYGFSKHHPNCQHYRGAAVVALALIRRLVAGIDAWAAEEDGIPDALWPAYCEARSAMMQPVTADEQRQP
jgi:hypothetical protein